MSCNANTSAIGAAIIGSVMRHIVVMLDPPATLPASSKALSMLRNAGVRSITL
jgi:hypothetical protein